MRVLAVVLSCLLLPAAAEARPASRAPARAARAARPHRSKQVKRVALDQPARPAAPPPGPAPLDPYADPYADDPVAAPDAADPDTRPPPPARPAAAAPHGRRGAGQSIGAPWAGRLEGATRLELGAGAFIRRPYRAFGTRTTVEHVRRAVRAALAEHAHAHVLAIGDVSAEHGGSISEHNSHRSGRDIDIGLFYKKKPAEYPQSFVSATAGNLDRAATWGLLVSLLESYGKDGGVQVIFLDYDVQGLLYKFAQESGVKSRVLDHIFQYPHGKGSQAGIVHHVPNHTDHFHVRYHCAKADTDCY